MTTTPVTTGRPRSFDEDAVLDAALDLFWERGYRATTTRHLEAALGLSQSSIYNAFGSKSELLSAALDRYEQRIEEVLVRPLSSAADPLAGIDVFFDSLRSWVADDGKRGCLIINLTAGDADDSDEIEQRTAAYRRHVRQTLADAVRRAAGAGLTATAAIPERADQLFGLVLALNVAARGGATTEIDGLVAAAHHLVDTLRKA